MEGKKVVVLPNLAGWNPETNFSSSENAQLDSTVSGVAVGYPIPQTDKQSEGADKFVLGSNLVLGNDETGGSDIDCGGLSSNNEKANESSYELQRTVKVPNTLLAEVEREHLCSHVSTGSFDSMDKISLSIAIRDVIRDELNSPLVLSESEHTELVSTERKIFVRLMESINKQLVSLYTLKLKILLTVSSIFSIDYSSVRLPQRITPFPLDMRRGYSLLIADLHDRISQINAAISNVVAFEAQVKGTDLIEVMGSHPTNFSFCSQNFIVSDDSTALTDLRLAIRQLEELLTAPLATSVGGIVLRTEPTQPDVLNPSKAPIKSEHYARGIVLPITNIVAQRSHKLNNIPASVPSKTGYVIESADEVFHACGVESGFLNMASDEINGINGIFNGSVDDELTAFFLKNRTLPLSMDILKEMNEKLAALDPLLVPPT